MGLPNLVLPRRLLALSGSTPGNRSALTARRSRGRRGQSLVEFALITPILLLMFVAMADLARLYTTMTTIESAAREAADYGAFDSQYWTDPDFVRTEMRRRACIASSTLADYDKPDGAPDDQCTNPQVVSIRLLAPPDHTTEPADFSACTDSEAAYPCWVEVTLEYRFTLMLPLHITLFDFQFGFPNDLTFQRTSTYAITDLQLESQAPPAGTPGPGTDPTMGPTPTPEPTASEPAPTESATPGPETPTPDPDPTPTPEPAPTPTPEPTPEPTPQPTPSPLPDPTPDPNQTPTPSPS